VIQTPSGIQSTIRRDFVTYHQKACCYVIFFQSSATSTGWRILNISIIPNLFSHVLVNYFKDPRQKEEDMIGIVYGLTYFAPIKKSMCPHPDSQIVSLHHENIGWSMSLLILIGFVSLANKNPKPVNIQPALVHLYKVI